MRMQRSNTVRAAVAIVAIGLAGAGCADKIGESIAERAIENACAEEGQQCNVDIDGDSVQLQTEDGSMSVDENGNAVIVGADGETINVDADDAGNMTITDGSGSVVVQQDGDDGTFTGDDGDTTFTTSGEVPAEFPSGIALPDGAIVSGSTVVGDLSTPGGMVMLYVTVPGELTDVAAAATRGVAAGGYTEQSRTETPDGSFYVYSGNGHAVSLTVSPDAASGGVVAAYTIAPEI